MGDEYSECKSVTACLVERDAPAFNVDIFAVDSTSTANPAGSSILAGRPERR